MPKKESESREPSRAAKSNGSRAESPKKRDKIEESNTPNNQVEMIVVIRNNDKTIVASYYAGSLTDKAEKNSIKQGVRQCINESNKIEIGKRYSVSGDHSNAIHYTLDKQGRIYAIVTAKKYSVRLAFAALDEVKSDFSSEFGPKVPSATEESLSKISKETLQEIASKYADPASLDKLVAVQEKINVVKVVMNENIKQVLENTEKLDNIEEKSKEIVEQSIAFKKSSKDLHEKMFWKKIKMWLLIGGLITFLLIIIIVPLTVNSGKK